MTQPVITEAQRNELRASAAYRRTQFIEGLDDGHMVVDSAHLLDLLDAADREAEMVEGIDAILPSAQPWPHQTMHQIYAALRVLIGRDE